jgi:hypothetical protein
MTDLHYFVWDDHKDFLVTAHAKSVKKARELALHAIEDSTMYKPLREEARWFVLQIEPFIYHGEQAQFACRSDKTTLDQYEDLCRADEQMKVLWKRIKWLEANS